MPRDVVFETTCSLTRPEARADACVHVLSLAFTGLAAFVLGRDAIAGGGAQALALGAYAATLVVLFCCSALNSLDFGGRRGDVINRLDQAAIFFLIAGTYTPFALLGLGGATGRDLTLSVWAGALLGAWANLYWPDLPMRIRVPAYLVLGWSVLTVFGAVEAVLPHPSFVLLVGGGLLYNVGVVVFVWRRLPYRQALWHVFVLLGAVSHFVAVLDLLAPHAPLGVALGAWLAGT